MEAKGRTALIGCAPRREKLACGLYHLEQKAYLPGTTHPLWVSQRKLAHRSQPQAIPRVLERRKDSLRLAQSNAGKARKLSEASY